MDELVGRGPPRFRGGESGVAAVWRMLSGEWRMAMGGGCCAGAVVEVGDALSDGALVVVD